MRVFNLTRTMALALTVTVTGFVGAGLALAESQESAQMDTAPGPAYMTIDGKVSKIEGDVYTVQSSAPDYLGNGINVNEVRVYVGQETKKLHGDKKVGDKIRAEVTRGGFANSIQ